MILEMLLGSSALILAVFALRAVLGRRMGARLRYALWLLVLLRLLLPVHLGRSAVSPANLARFSERDGTVYSVPLATGQPSTLGVSIKPDGGLGDANSFGYPLANADGTVTRYGWKHALPDVLPLLWKNGIGIAAAWYLLCNVLFYRGLRRTRTFLRTLGKVPVYAADTPSPCLFGLFRPAIYVTAEAARDPDTLSHVLLHEGTHLRHGDHLWAFLRTVCLAVWWFNPLVYLAAAASRRDCELFCDDAVIRLLGEEQRVEYGRTLLALAGKKRAGTASCAAATLSSGGRPLRQRIRAIAKWAKPKKWAILAAAVLALLAGACAFSGAREGATAEPEPPAAPEALEPTPQPQSETGSDEASGQSAVQASETETEEPSNQSDAVTLVIYGRWNEEEDIWDSTESEYILSPEDSEFITGLFYDHEKEVIDSPIASPATLEFRTGEDHISSSMGGLNIFDGSIGGESIVMDLSESERERVRQIILTYTSVYANPDIDEAPSQSAVQASETETEEPSNQSDAVTLVIHGRWNEEEDSWDSTKSEYILSPEDSEFITGLFYDHEKEVIDSPIASPATLEFRTGEDHLSSSMGALDTFFGSVGEESVVMDLSESERETVRKIILSYALNDIPAPEDETDGMMEEYVRDTKRRNETLISSGQEDIAVTITFADYLSFQEFGEYTEAYGIEAELLHARGRMKDGTRITITSRTSKGLQETERLLLDEASRGNYEFVGITAANTKVSSEQLREISADERTYLADTQGDVSTGTAEAAAAENPETEDWYPQHLTWDLEDMGILG